MIIGIGCDVVEHHTTEKLNWQSDSTLLGRLFSPKELKIYNEEKTVKFISGRFAAKEAILKCLGTGIYDGISLSHIEILRSSDGKPIVELFNLVQLLSNEMKIKLWHVTITHSSTSSTAFVVAEG